MKITTFKWVNGKHEPDKEIEVEDLRFIVDFGGDGEPEQRVWVSEQDGRLWIDSRPDSEIAVFPGNRVIGIECKPI